MVAPLLPKSAPFAADDIATLNNIVTRATREQRSWLAGFLAGFDAAQAGPAAAVAARPRVPLTILYGSESGNCESLALKARKTAQKNGFDAKVFDLADFSVDQLAKAQNVVVYLATWGEGEPPQRAIDFYAALMSDTAPNLDKLNFAVLALGDTAYAQFCATGKAVDSRLEALGARRTAARADLDLDFAKAAAAWTDNALKAFAPVEPSKVVHVDFKSAASELDDDEPQFTAENPLEAEIGGLINLNGSGSSRETWHVELTSSQPGFVYQPGDAIGVLPTNDPELAAKLLDAVGLGGDAALIKTLVKSHDITTLSRPIVTAYAKLVDRTDIAWLAQGEAFAPYASTRQLLDLFAEHRENLTAPQLLSLLRPLPGRLYSAASSQRAHEGEAHLLIGAVRWNSHGHERKGVASTFFADRRKVGDTARIYVKPNRHFRLPQDQARPIIMIGAGTGIAPYRGFIEDRAETGAIGKSWLFFGERNFSNDFLYQLEWQDHIAAKALSRIDVAFSRDQPEKIYVQHRLWERRDELLGWINDGAHVYVCGDEKGMAKDVDATLVRILGGNETGTAKLAELRKAGRYQRDVY
ncbi:MAG: flavodoxin domain-containing protein [Hyphomicrobiaceae bacterium]